MSGGSLFDGWGGIARILGVGTLAYVALVGLLRVSGKRTLAKMNAFDLVVTVALGSTLATILLSRDVSLAEGTTGLALLVALQFAVAWLSVRAGAVRRLAKSRPAIVLHEGRMLEDALRCNRVTGVRSARPSAHRGSVISHGWRRSCWKPTAASA